MTNFIPLFMYLQYPLQKFICEDMGIGYPCCRKTLYSTHKFCWWKSIVVITSERSSRVRFTCFTIIFFRIGLLGHHKSSCLEINVHKRSISILFLSWELKVLNNAYFPLRYYFNIFISCSGIIVTENFTKILTNLSFCEFIY